MNRRTRNFIAMSSYTLLALGAGRVLGQSPPPPIPDWCPICMSDGCAFGMAMACKEGCGDDYEADGCYNAYEACGDPPAKQVLCRDDL